MFMGPRLLFALSLTLPAAACHGQAVRDASECVPLQVGETESSWRSTARGTRGRRSWSSTPTSRPRWRPAWRRSGRAGGWSRCGPAGGASWRRGHYEALAAEGFAVVLQDNERAADEGSLSVWAARQGIPYVNVEAEHGQRDRQVEMLEALARVLG